MSGVPCRRGPRARTPICVAFRGSICRVGATFCAPTASAHRWFVRVAGLTTLLTAATVPNRCFGEARTLFHRNRRCNGLPSVLSVGVAPSNARHQH
jgi:hypothetical protein